MLPRAKVRLNTLVASTLVRHVPDYWYASVMILLLCFLSPTSSYPDIALLIGWRHDLPRTMPLTRFCIHTNHRWPQATSPHNLQPLGVHRFSRARHSRCQSSWYLYYVSIQARVDRSFAIWNLQNERRLRCSLLEVKRPSSRRP